MTPHPFTEDQLAEKLTIKQRGWLSLDEAEPEVLKV